MLYIDCVMSKFARSATSYCDCLAFSLSLSLFSNGVTEHYRVQELLESHLVDNNESLPSPSLSSLFSYFLSHSLSTNSVKTSTISTTTMVATDVAVSVLCPLFDDDLRGFFFPSPPLVS